MQRIRGEADNFAGMPFASRWIATATPCMSTAQPTFTTLKPTTLLGASSTSWDADPLALTTSLRTPQGRLIIEVEKEALFKLAQPDDHNFLDTYLREAGRIREIALRAAADHANVVRICAQDV